MCPSAMDSGNRIVPIGAELEVSFSPESVDEINTESNVGRPCFSIDDGCEVEENLSSKDIHSEPQLDKKDTVTKQRLNDCVSIFCSIKEKKQNNQGRKLVIQTKETQASGQDELQSEIRKPRSPSALKLPNSPPSESKKSVQFADSIGRDLVSVQLFNSNADIGVIEDDLCTPAVDAFAIWTAAASAEPDHRQLFIRSSLLDKEQINQVVESQNVCIESITCKGMLISGLILVKNIAYDKQVRLRYTLDHWRSYQEIPCMFSFSKFAGTRDTFCFSLCLPRDLPVGICSEICVQYSADGRTFWDNNNGQNYKIDVCAVTPTYQPDEFEIWSDTLHSSAPFMGTF